MDKGTLKKEIAQRQADMHLTLDRQGQRLEKLDGHIMHIHELIAELKEHLEEKRLAKAS